MSRKLATIQTIKELLPIPGADSIELATFENIGWKCVVKKDEFQIGDKAVYFEIDSLLPLTPTFEFLAKGNTPKKMTLDGGEVVEGYRLKTVKLRGQLSQGLALPIARVFLSNHKYKIIIKESLAKPRITVTPDRVTLKFQSEEQRKQKEFIALGFVVDILANNKVLQSYRKADDFDDSEIVLFSDKNDKHIHATNFFQDNNEDLSEILNIYKYEPPISPELAGIAKGNFPSFIPKTDETRIQNCWNMVQKYKDLSWYASIKYDGSSATFYKKDGEFGACSRNLELKETESNTFWKIANKFDLKNKLPEGFAVQGEVYGEGIQKNPHKIKGTDFRVFNVYDINEGKYLDFEKMIYFVDKLNLSFAKTIKLDKINNIYYNNITNLTMQDLLDLADETGLEGLVFRPLQEINDPNFGRVSFKVISNKYLLKN
jgi:RNA ligase (TIGR02306 family)